MYKVIKAFTDLHDEDYPYSVGDSFPRVGINVTEKRLKELSGCENKQGMPLIEKVADEALPAAVRKAVRPEADPGDSGRGYRS